MEDYESILTSADKSYTPYDRAAWAKQKQEERERAYSLIDRTARNIAGDGELLRRYLDVQSRFNRYSVSNALLITAQRPDATKLADFRTWKEEKSYVRKGESGITLLEPGEEYTREDGSIGVSYNTKKVFDIAQTDSRQKTARSVRYDGTLLLRALINDAPCRMVISEELPEGLGAVYDPKDKAIYVRHGMEPGDIFRSLAQELAHARLDGGSYTRADCAFTAYCVSYILCVRSGVDTGMYDFGDIPRAFRESDARGIRSELGRIRDTANEISADMAKVLEPRQKQKDKSRQDGVG